MGWFVDPTLLEISDPHSPFMSEELFAPVMAVYVYPDAEWEPALRLVDSTTEFGLTGAVFANDESAIAEADEVLRYAAGNYYVNDKPTGAAVGQQPFGGARASGTNDKAGTVWNLIRFVSPRAVKRTHEPDRDPYFPRPRQLTRFASTRLKIKSVETVPVAGVVRMTLCIGMTCAVTPARLQAVATPLSLLYGSSGGECVVVASKGGAEQDPAWFMNLRADPSVGVQVGTRRTRPTARSAAARARRNGRADSRLGAGR